MKRTFLDTPKRMSIALACALSLSASICGAAGVSFDPTSTWYGRAGGPVAPGSLTIRAAQHTADSSNTVATSGRAGAPIGAAAVVAAAGVKASAAVAAGAGCTRFGRAGGPVGIDALSCSSPVQGEATVAKASAR